MEHTTSQQLGARLSQVRSEAGLSLSRLVGDLAKHGINVTRQAVARWERGEIDLRLDQTEVWCRVLGTSLLDELAVLSEHCTECGNRCSGVGSDEQVRCCRCLASFDDELCGWCSELASSERAAAAE